MTFFSDRSRQVVRACAAAVTVLALLAACGDDPVDGSDGASPSAPTATDAPEEAATDDRSPGTVTTPQASPTGTDAAAEGGPPAGGQGAGVDGPDPEAFEGEPTGTFEAASAPLSSGSVPRPFTCEGPNKSMPVDWRDVPQDATALAFVLVDEDGPDGPRLHWQITDIDPAPGHLPGDTVPAGATVGVNGFGEAAYEGPCSESGEEHRFVFTAYALSAPMAPPETADVAAVRGAYADGAVAEASFTFTYSGPTDG